MMTNRMTTKTIVTSMSQSMRWPCSDTSRGSPMPASGLGTAPARPAVTVTSVAASSAVNCLMSRAVLSIPMLSVPKSIGE